MIAAYIWKSRCATADRLVAITDDLVLVANAAAHLLPLFQARLEQGMLPDNLPGARLAMVPFDAISEVRYTRDSRDLDIYSVNALGRQHLNVAFETCTARDEFYGRLRRQLPHLDESEKSVGPLRAALGPLLLAGASATVSTMAWLTQASALDTANASAVLSQSLVILQSGADPVLLGSLAALVALVAGSLSVKRLRQPPVMIQLSQPQAVTGRAVQSPP